MSKPLDSAVLKADSANENPSQSVLVTGASSGIGLAIALCMAKAGWRVYAGVRQDKDAEHLIRVSDESLMPVFLDVTDSSAIDSVRAQIEHETGNAGLTALVNNAGIPLGGPLEFLGMERFRQQLEINVIGAMAVTQAFLPLLRKARGRIVTISSPYCRFSAPFYGPYAATKHAMLALNEALRLELRPWDMPVIWIEASDVNTPIWGKVVKLMDEFETGASQQTKELYGGVLALRSRFAQHGMPPERVAAVVEHVLQCRRPKPRYLVGWQARGFALLNYLPTALRDRIIVANLPKYGPDSK